MAKLSYDCPKGRRVKNRYFVWVIIDFDDEAHGNYWYCHDKKWRTNEELENIRIGHSNTAQCHSVRQFRRLLRNWKSYMPKGTKFMLVNRYDCWCVKGTI